MTDEGRVVGGVKEELVKEQKKVFHRAVSTVNQAEVQQLEKHVAVA